MTSPNFNKARATTLLRHNPIKLLLLQSSINLIACLAACLATRIYITADSDRLTLMVVISGFFIVSSGLVVLQSMRAMKSYKQEIEKAAALLLSIFKHSEIEERSLSNKSLIEIADECSIVSENQRQAAQLIADFSSDLLLSLTDDLKIVELNASASRQWQQARLNLIGLPFEKLIVEADRVAMHSYFQLAKESDQINSFECRMQIGNGKIIDVLWTIEYSKSMSAFYCIGKDVSAEKEIQRLRAEITAMVSHDLRAPVSGLSFFLEGLMRGELGNLNENGRAQVGRNRQNVEQMLRLINQLLDAEKLESGEIKMDVKIVPVDSIVESASSLLGDFAEQKGVRIRYAESGTLVHADFDRSVQILSNLLSNAIKFSPKDGEVVINGKADGKDVHLQVMDEGPGVPASLRSDLFQRFKAQNQGAEQIVKSSGLGLYLAKNLATMQDGDIGLANEERKGSCFWFQLKQASEDELPGYLD